jgi:hypothetical protein
MSLVFLQDAFLKLGYLLLFPFLALSAGHANVRSIAVDGHDLFLLAFDFVFVSLLGDMYVVK